MTNEEKKEYLNEYKLACKKVVALQEQLESLREVEQSAKVQKLSDMPKGSGSRQSDLSDLMIRIEELQEEVDTALDKCIEKKLEIEESLICRVDDEEARVLRYRYIKLLGWKEIAKRLDYSVRHVQRIHGRAIENYDI